MKRVVFIQNGELDGPGLFARILSERGVDLRVVQAWRGEPLPDTPDESDGFAIGGGGISVYDADRFPFLSDEIAFARRVRETGKPLLGMCLGAQVMAAAFGGAVFPNRAKEIGFHNIHFTPAAEEDPLWHGQTAAFKPVHWHGDTFSLPPDATLLASSALTPNQLFRLDDALYGFQFHLEIDRPVLSAMVGADDGELPASGVDPAEFLKAAEEILPTIEPTAREIFSRWTQLAAGSPSRNNAVHSVPPLSS